MEKSVTHGTFVIERNYPATAERVFAAFSDPAKKRRWFGDGSESAFEEFQMDFRVGGRERRVSRLKEGTPFAGVALVNETSYQDIVPGRRIVFAYTMTLGEHRISASLATVELLPAEKGTILIFTEQVAFFEGADGLEMRRGGWRKLLDRLDAELSR